MKHLLLIAIAGILSLACEAQVGGEQNLSIGRLAGANLIRQSHTIIIGDFKNSEVRNDYKDCAFDVDWNYEYFKTPDGKRLKAYLQKQFAKHQSISDNSILISLMKETKQYILDYHWGNIIWWSEQREFKERMLKIEREEKLEKVKKINKETLNPKINRL